jgi:hypothetical protein
MLYKAPTITDYGSIASHTFTTPGGVGVKGGVEPFAHLDVHCELSAFTGTDPGDNPACNP